MQIAELVTGPQGQSGALATALIGTWLAHVWGYLPGAVAIVGGVLAICWYIVMLWESKTVQDWHAKSSAKRKIAKIVKLQAGVKIAMAQLEALEVRSAARTDAAEKVSNAAAEAAVVLARSASAETAADLNDESKK
jgi:hypothetical protein